MALAGLSISAFASFFFSTLTSKFARALLEDTEEVLKNQKELKVHRIEWQKPDDSYGVMSVTAAPLEDSKANFLGVVSYNFV